MLLQQSRSHRHFLFKSSDKCSLYRYILKTKGKRKSLVFPFYILHFCLSCWEGPLEEEMASHSNILAWKIPWTDELGGPQSMGSQRVGHNWATFTSLSIGIGVGMWLSKIVLCSYSDIQSHPAICDPMYNSPLGSSVHVIHQAKILECVAIFLSRKSSHSKDWAHVSYTSWICRHIL